MNSAGIKKLSLYMVSLFLLAQCSFSPPSAPIWDVDLNIPLINKTYTIADLVDGLEGLKVDSLNNLSIEFETKIDTFDALNQLSIKGIAQSFGKKLGTFNVKSPGSRSLDVQLQDIYPPATALNGTQVPVPPFQFQLPPQSLPPFETLQWVEISSGSIDLTIQNNLAIGLGKPIRIELRDARDDTIVAQWEFADFINPGQSQTERLDLSGKRLSGNLAISVAGASPGSSSPVLIRSTDGFVITVDVSDLQVSGAAAKLDPQHISFDEKMKVSDSVVVTQAKIRKGTIEVELSGNLPLDSQISFSLPDFVNADSTILSENLVLLQDLTNKLVIDLAGYTFQPEQGDFGEQFVRVSANITTLQSPNELVELNAADSVFASFNISPIYFSEISGRFYSKNIEIPKQSFQIDLPTDIDSVQLKDAQIELMLFNTIGFPAKTHIFVTGYNDAGDQVTLVIQETIQPGDQNGNPVLSKIKLTSQNSTITELLNLFPTRIEVSGTVDIGQPDSPGTIRETDYVTGKLKFSAPVAFQLPAQKFETDVTEITMDTEARKRIQTNLEHGQFIAKTQSHLPVGAFFNLYFAEQDSNVFAKPDLTIGPITVESGQIDPQNETVQMPRESEINISLSKDELLFFANEKIYSGIQIHFPGTNGQIVRLLASDYLHIQAYVNLKVRVQDDSQ